MVHGGSLCGYTYVYGSSLYDKDLQFYGMWTTKIRLVKIMLIKKNT